jgi:hypothetical protein
MRRDTWRCFESAFANSDCAKAKPTCATWSSLTDGERLRSNDEAMAHRHTGASWRTGIDLAQRRRPREPRDICRAVRRLDDAGYHGPGI